VIFLKFYQQKITFLFFFTTDFENALLFKQGVFKVGGKLQNDFLKTLFYTAIAAFFRNFGLINIKNQPKH
jgi:hypothetical protein